MKAEIKDVIVGVRLTSREADSLDHIARSLGWSRGQLLRELFQRFVETHRQPVKELQNND
jgi:predicted HTH domain antitoxin